MRLLKLMLITTISMVAAHATVAAGASFNFSYSGRLTEANGKPVAGPVSLSMSFYRTATGGAPVLTVTDGLASVPLQEGLFQVSLALSGSDFHEAFPAVTEAVYIEITDLTHRPDAPYDRQLVAMVPYAAKVPVDNVTLEFNNQGELTLKSTPNGGTAAISSINAAASGTIAAARLPALSGDLSGTLDAASVTKIQGRAVAATAPNNNDVLKWNGTTWVPAAVEAGSTITAATALALGSVTSSVQAGLVATPFGAAPGQTGELRFKELTAGGDNFVGLKAPDAIPGGGGTGIIWTLPGADGASGQVLSTNGAGILAWASAGVDTNAKTLCADNQYLRGDDASTVCRTAAQIVSDGGGLSSGAIVNADINASAAIADTKLAVIATAGKVADTALSANVSLLGNSIGLTSEVSGILPVANGGTGVASALTGVAIGNGASAMSSVAGTANQYLRRNAGNTAYEFASLGALAALAEVSGGAGGTITDDSITNDDIKSNAGIADTKLATIATAGKVADTALSANVSLLGSSISLTTEITGTLDLGNGGTGATTQAGAANAILPTQTSNSGKYLTTDGTNVSWATVSGGSASSLAASDGTPSQALAVDAAGYVGIGTTAPLAALDISSTTLMLGADVGATSRTNSTGKVGYVVLPHYTNSQAQVSAFIANSTATANNVYFGGGSSAYTAANALHFYTAATSTTIEGSERMTILGSGNVGIGTTAPSSPLEVAGTVKISSGDLYIPDVNNRISNEFGNLYQYSAGAIKLVSPTIYASGNVGIGTSAPGTLLHTVQTINAGSGLTIDNNSTGNAALAGFSVGEDSLNSPWRGLYMSHFNSGFTSAGLRIPLSAMITAGVGDTAGLTIGTDYGSGGAPIRFYTKGLVGGTSNVRLMIDGSGKVGVGMGTNTPISTLHLGGGDAQGTFAAATVALGYSSSGGYSHFIHTRHNGSTSANNAIDFYTSDGTAGGVYPTNAVHNLTMLAGNVGIGTTGPTSKLEVAGDISTGGGGILWKTYSGTTPAAGFTFDVAHGLTASKIISITCSINFAGTSYFSIGPTGATGDQRYVSWGTTDMSVFYDADANWQSRAYRCLAQYVP